MKLNVSPKSAKLSAFWSKRFRRPAKPAKPAKPVVFGIGINHTNSDSSKSTVSRIGTNQAHPI